MLLFGAHVVRAADYAIKFNPEVGITPLDSALTRNNELGGLGWVQNGKDALKPQTAYQQVKIAIYLKLGLQKEL